MCSETVGGGKGGVYLQRREGAQLSTPQCTFETNSFTSPYLTPQTAESRSVVKEMTLNPTLL